MIMIIGAVLCFGLFGFLATWLVAKGLQRLGILREPTEVELAGADTWHNRDIYPYGAGVVTEFEALERKEAALL